MVVLVAANIDNIHGTWAGRWGSSLASWTIWAALGWVGFAAQLQLGATVGAMLLAPVAAVSTAVAVGALRARRFAPPPDEVSWQRTVDIVCAIGAALALAALVTSTGRQALLLTIVTDAIAAIPTDTAAYREPDSLPMAPFTAGAASAVLDPGRRPELGVRRRGLRRLPLRHVPRPGVADPLAPRRAGGRARRAVSSRPPSRRRSAGRWTPRRSGSCGPSPPRYWSAPHCWARPWRAACSRCTSRCRAPPPPRPRGGWRGDHR